MIKVRRQKWKAKKLGVKSKITIGHKLGGNENPKSLGVKSKRAKVWRLSRKPQNDKS